MPVTINGGDGITNASWTTGTRPSNPAAGQMGYNTETKTLEFYDAEADEWESLQKNRFIFATGGTVTDINVNGNDFRVHEFTSDGNFDIVDGSDDIEYLVVAGGGAGGGNSDRGGGGGAGGLISGIFTDLNPGSYSVVVGDGGSKVTDSLGNNGDNSQFGSLLTALGGGGGAVTDNSAVGDGGSGGGQGGNTPANDGPGGQGLQPDSSSGGSGNDGGGNTGGDGGGAGGGGAGASGADATGTEDGRPGGDGIESSITGANQFYAGGGAGDAREQFNGSPGVGGAGGGGDEKTDGTPNTGGGGGGSGGSGGSGIVILRYRIG